jgi:Na+/proline symporter
LLGYLYFKLAGEAYALVSIGLISVRAVAQFAPAILGGISGKAALARGLRGLSAGFGVWLYTLRCRRSPVPDGCRSVCSNRACSASRCSPLQLFGLAGLDQISHVMI